MDANLVPVLNESFQIALPEDISAEVLREKLSSHVNYLIQSDFQKLVSVLYRLDVSETKLKNLLRKYPDTNAGDIISDLIIERQLQKIRTRQQFKRDENINDDEKW